MFRQKNAILREQLCSFLIHLNVNTVGDKSEYHIYVEVAQKGTQMLPEDGTILPKHVGAVVKEK
jgi:hypothetical protein